MVPWFLPATSHHLRIRLYINVYICLQCATVIYTGESPFPPPSSFLIHTHTHTSTGLPPYFPPHPSPFLSISPALCVLLQRSNFPFDFGGNAFFTNQRGSQATPPSHSSSFTPPSSLPSSPALPSRSSILPPSALQAREEIKEPPSFPC